MKKMLATLSFSLAATWTAADNNNWAKWRGTDMTGIAAEARPPLEWSEEKNVKWKVPIPGHGSSTPIIWGKHLFVLTAVPSDGSTPSLPPHRKDDIGTNRSRRGRRMVAPASVEQKFMVMALNRSDGSIFWKRTATTAVPHEGKQQNNSYASASASTDGETLITYFGSWGLYAYDLEGNLKWSKDLGNMKTRNGFGEGATPALQGDNVVVQWDHEDQSFIAAINTLNGEERWRANRNEATSWGTPLIVKHDGRYQVVTTGTNSVTSYDLETGKIVWKGPGLTPNAIPSPIEKDGIVYVTSGYRGNAAFAVRLSDAKGDITDTSAILWHLDRDTPYVPSPLLHNNILYLIKSNSAILTAINVATGKAFYGPERLEGIYEIYASPVGVGDNVIILGRDGNALVLKNEPKLRILATNSLDDGFDASPAITENELYLRGYTYLYRISED